MKFYLKLGFWLATAAVFMMALAPWVQVHASGSLDHSEIVLLDESKITPAISAVPETHVYDGQPRYITATITDNLPLTVVYYDFDDNIVTDPTIPGTYVVDISFAGNDAYNPVSKTVSLTITNGEFDQAVFAGKTLTYDGYVHSLTVTGVPEGTTITYLNNDKTDAGSYEVTAIISKPYYNDHVMTNMLVINKIVPTITASNLDLVYDTLPHHITTAISHGLTMNEEYRNELGEVVLDPTDAGKYTLVLSYAGDANHAEVSKTVFLTIRPAAISGVILPDLTVVYDGNLHNLTATGVPVGATVVYNSTGYVNAGIYAIGVTVSKANYKDCYATGTLTIRRANLQGVVTFNDLTLVYDGLMHSLEVNGLPESGATVRYTHHTLTSSGETTAMAVVEGSNYETLTLYAKLRILKAASVIAVPMTVFQYDYDGTPKEVSATLNHAETELIYAPSRTYTDAGIYDIIIVAPETANYLGASVAVTLVIDRIEIEGVTFEDLTLVFDGQEHELLADNVPEGCTVIYTNNRHRNAGTHLATALITRTNYNDLELSAVLTIQKAEATITVDPASLAKVYDGTLHAVGATLNHAESSLSYAGAIGYVNAGTYDIVISALETQNYLSVSVGVTLVISKAEAVIMAAPVQHLLYDGTIRKALATLNHTEAVLVIPEHISAGTYEDTISIPETANYFSRSITVTLIVDKALTIITAQLLQSHVYDGTFKSVVASINHNETVLEYATEPGYVNAGDYPIRLFTEETANYLAASLDITLSIAKAPAVIEAPEVQSHVYDGAFKEVAAHLNHTEAELTYSPTNGYTEVGSYSILIEAAESDNYQAVSRQITLRIDRITTVITADLIQTFVYDGTMKEVTATINHTETELSYSPSQGCIDAGTYQITVISPETAHYAEATLEVTLVIQKAASAITAELLQTHVYDGTLKDILATLNHNETELTYSPAQGFINAGEYEILITAPESNNYLSSELEVTLKIDKAELIGITFSDMTVSYDGLEHALEVEGLPEGAMVTYVNNRGTNVCSITGEALITKENYNDLTLTANLSIIQAISEIEALDVQTFAYDEEAHDILASLNFVGTELTFTPSKSFTEVGEYDVVISVDETPNNTAASKTVHVVIVKGTPVIEASDTNVVYDGQGHFITATVNHNLSLQYVYYNSQAETTAEPVNADRYLVRIFFSGNECFLPVEKYVTLNIRRAVLEGIRLDSLNVTYDGLTHSLTLVNPVADTDVVIENNQHVQIGEYTVKATISKNNYETLVLSSTLRIVKKILTITGVEAAERAYDGTPMITLCGGELEGVVAGEDVGFVLGYGTVDDAHAGNLKTVNTFIILIGTDAAHYSLVQPDLKVNILPRFVKVNAPGLVKIADESRTIDVDHLCLAGIIGDDDLTLSGNPWGELASSDPANDVAVLIHGLSLAGDDAANYAMDLTGITGDILLPDLNLSTDGGHIRVTSCTGFDTELTVNFTKITDRTPLAQLDEKIRNLNKNQIICNAYLLEVSDQEEELVLDRPAKVELEIPEELRGTNNLFVYHITESGCRKVQAFRYEDKMVFEASEFGYFVITSVPAISYLMLAAIIFSVIVLTVAIIYLIFRYHHRLERQN